MSATYLMSYPGPAWRVRGGANVRSANRQATSPRAALREWIALADLIVRAGGHILVMPPPAVEPPLTGLPYTSSAGFLFRGADEILFLLANMAAPHRQPERDFVRLFAAEAGLKTRVAAAVWEGQADLLLVGGNRYLATWGPRSSRQSVDEVRTLLPPNSRLLDLQIQAPFFHGETCVASLANRSGDLVLLVHGGALASGSLESIRRFVGNAVEVYPIDREDAEAGACTGLCVDGTVILPRGISSGVRGQLIRRGFSIEEIDLPELFGKGGGGPRSLINELRGLVLNPGAPDYAGKRDTLLENLKSYPEVAPTQGETKGA